MSQGSAREERSNAGMQHAGCGLRMVATVQQWGDPPEWSKNAYAGLSSPHMLSASALNTMTKG